MGRPVSGENEKLILKIITLLLNENKSSREHIVYGPNYSAVHSILAHMRVSTKVVDAVVLECLKLYKKSIFNSEALIQASRFLQYGTSLSAAEKVVAQLALSGYVGSVEDVARCYLGRGLLPEEVHALINNYCNNTGSQCDDTENTLGRIAVKYLSLAEAEDAKAKLAQFNKEFHSHLD